MKNGLLYLLPFLSSFSYAQVGIGTATPKAFFNVPEGRTVLFGNDTTGSVSSSQIFTPKLIWYSTKSAFRVGAISGSVDNYSAWDYANTGYYSFASGLNTQARGYAATSLGSRTTASGNYATSMGNNATASGEFSTAMGFSTTASNYYATALGYQTTASGEAATAIGRGTTASGIAAIAMGNSSFASGENATAIGSSAFANGRNSMALGSFVSTSTKSGSFILGDNTDANSITNTYVNSANNQMMMRFSGGYMLYSSAPNTQASAVGVQLASGDNAWQTLSDSTRKENFRAVDGVDFLKKIAQMRLGSWNYKGQDARLYRHYGPMAQDFFAAFGHDALGIIGEDKSINQADFDGVNLIAIQALIQEVNQLKEDNNNWRQENAALKIQMQARLEKIEATLQGQTTNQTLTLKP